MKQRQVNISGEVFTPNPPKTTTPRPSTEIWRYIARVLFYGQLILTLLLILPTFITQSNLTAVAFAGSEDIAATGAYQPAWSYESSHDIEWYFTAPEVSIVITAEGVLAIDQENGELRWHFDVDAYHPSYFEHIPYTQFALASFPVECRIGGPPVALIDLTTGEELWTSKKNSLVLSYGSFLVPHKNGLLVYGQRADIGNVLMLLDFNTGVPIWIVDHPFRGWPPDLFGEGAQPPLFDSEDTMILFLNGRAIRKYDLTNGKLIWEAQDLKRAGRGSGLFGAKTQEEDVEFTPTPTPAAGYAPMVLSMDGKCFYAPHHNTVGAFSTYNGARRWMNPAKLDGIASQIEHTPQGLLVRTIPDPEDPEESSTHGLSMIDIRNGRELWRKSRSDSGFLKEIFGVWLDSTPYMVVGNRIIMAADDKLFSITLDKGSEKKLCDLDFEGVDDVYWLEVLDDQFLVTGEQNVVWCDFSGKIIRRVYYDPPDDFNKGLAWLAAAALVNSMDDIRMGRLTISMHASYSGGFEDLLRDYTATVGGAEYIYMLTESDNGPQIVRISKYDGAESGRVTVDTREPDYLICPFTGNMLWKSSERTISCFDFQ